MNVGYRDPCLVVVVVDGQDYFIRLSAFWFSHRRDHVKRRHNATTSERGATGTSMCANTLNLPFIDFVYTISELNSVLGREIAVSWEGSPADAAFIFTTQATAILTCD
ncbi:hypothetical protein IG631_20418 [Alternaria alternata]|nr:hypothetical protein IG631_20418 [Alternaria alternata]